LHQQKQLIAFRKKLHQHPELSGQEYETANKVVEYLNSLKPDLLIKNLGETGVLALFGQEKNRPTVFFRAELDALPIEELNDFEHRSKQAGVSHKCGHDGHTTILLALAEKVVEQAVELNVGLLFQPAEENGSGALAVLNDPKFKQFQPDYIFALHNLPGYPLNQIVIRDGHFTPAVKSVIYKLDGKTAHAAEPEKGINPALAMAEILTQAAAISKNELEDLALITAVHALLGEKAYGVSAGQAELHFTLRCWNNKRMQALEHELLTAVEQIAQKHQLKLSMETLEEFQANENAADAVALIREASQHAGLALTERESPMKWGEDFGAFTQKLRGAIFGLGAGENCPALHNPDYDFPDQLIESGSSIFYQILQAIQKKTC
jgi:amidohydrolase